MQKVFFDIFSFRYWDYNFQ